MLVNLALLVGFWALAATRSEITLPFVVRIIRLSPDLGLIIILVNLIGASWALTGAIWAFALLRRQAPPTPSL